MADGLEAEGSGGGHLRIYFLPSDFDGPGSYRCIFPAIELKKRGWDVWLTKAHLQQLQGRRVFTLDLPPPDAADVFVIHRRLEAEVVEFVHEAQALGKTVVASTDDNDLQLPSWHSAHGKGQGGSRNVNRANWHKTVPLADHLLVSTPKLKHAYRKLNPRSTVIPNYLDWRMWESRKPVYEARDWDRLRIGWLGAPGLRQGDLDLLKRVFVPWLRRHPWVQFASAGDERTHDLLGIPLAQRVTLQGIEFSQRRLHTMLRFDVGLIPLADCPFNEAKSHLKGMEYAALGIPALASPTASYRDWLDPEIGFLCSDRKDWEQALDALLDKGLREQMGRAARQKASEHTIEEHVDEWERFFTALGDRADARALDAAAAA